MALTDAVRPEPSRQGVPHRGADGQSMEERILQFGAGRFLRAFCDLFIQNALDDGQDVGRVVVAQSTAGDRASLLNLQGGRFHVWISGSLAGAPVDRVEEVSCVSRALVVEQDWDRLLALARSPHLRQVISNTTEKGYELDEADRPGQAPPASFPARLLLLLRARWGAGLPGLSILPCELVENNGDRLRALVTTLARRWALPADFAEWLTGRCAWHNTLVDRIVASPGRPRPGIEGDRLATVADPFALWAIQERPGVPPFLRHPCVRYVRDVGPFALRKIRILNGAHTALVCKALPSGIETVREAVEAPAIRRWLETLLFEEIVPTLEGRVEEPRWFAKAALERFRNPRIEHRLRDIALYNQAKVEIRLVATRNEYVQRFGRRPPLLDELLAAAGRSF